MSKMKSICWWGYLCCLHLVVLFGLLLIPEVRRQFQAEKQIPGSSIISEYDEYPDGGWIRVFTQDDRDPVLGIVENEGWINQLFVSLPDTPFVWYFEREKDQSWSLQIVKFDSSSQADHHFHNTSSHMMMDGGVYGILDGLPDFELVNDDGIKKLYEFESVQRTLINEVPDKTSP